jgi:malate/lactate dehydrogenase
MRVVLYGGAGGVGASAAFNLLAGGRGHEVVLVDSRSALVESHVLDLEQVVEARGAGSVRAGGMHDVAAADLVVVSASVPQQLTESRMTSLQENAGIVAELSEGLAGRDWRGVLLMVTNPVDPLVMLAHRRSGLAREQVVGYTLNDSLRLRTAIARLVDAPAGQVDAWVLGEHGGGAVPVFSRVAAGGRPLQLSAPRRRAACDFVRDWFARHVALEPGRSSTWTTGLGVARMVEALRAGTGELMPASVVLAGEYGIDGVSLTVPVRLGPGGVQGVEQWELAGDELQGMRRAAATVAAAAASIGVAVAPGASAAG